MIQRHRKKPKLSRRRIKRLLRTRSWHHDLQSDCIGIVKRVRGVSCGFHFIAYQELVERRIPLL